MVVVSFFKLLIQKDQLTSFIKLVMVSQQIIFPDYYHFNAILYERADEIILSLNLIKDITK